MNIFVDVAAKATSDPLFPPRTRISIMIFFIAPCNRIDDVHEIGDLLFSSPQLDQIRPIGASLLPQPYDMMLVSALHLVVTL